MKKVILLVVLQLAILSTAKSQKSKLDFGVQFGVNADLLCNKKNWFKLYFNTGVGLLYTQNIYKLSDNRLALYFNYRYSYRGFGTYEKSKHSKVFKKRQNGHFINISLIEQFACGNQLNNSRSLFNRKPQYYFSNYYNPIFTNDYKFSFGFGSSLIWRLCENKFFQRVGLLDVGVYNFSINYLNDGAAPFSLLGSTIGDLHDRWHTGGLVISAYCKTDTILVSHAFEFSYNKFTGFSKNSYEVSTELGLTEVSYKDSLEQLYNQGAYSFKYQLSLNSKLFGLGFIFYQPFNRDLQHGLHQGQYFSKHISEGVKKSGISINYGYFNLINK